MVRTPKIDKHGMKKGVWSEEEDNKLRDYVKKYGHWNWRQLPKYAGLSRCGKSCRLRWVNYLQPNMKHGNYTKEEDDLIIKLHSELGNKWSAIAMKLPGRSDNEIKNHWHTLLKNPTNQNLAILKKESSNEIIPQIKVHQDHKKSTPEASSSGTSNSRAESASWSSDSASNLHYSTTPSSSMSSNLYDFNWVFEDSVASLESFVETTDSLWKDPFLRYDNFMEPLVLEFFSPPSPIVVEESLWSYEL